MNRAKQTVVQHQGAFILACIIVGGLLFTGVGMLLNSFNV